MMTLRKSILWGATALLLTATSASAQERLVISGGTVHPVAGESYQGTIVIEDGKIVAAGPNLSAPTGAKTIDATGLHIYPGLFDAASNLGLVEVGAIEVMNDSRELGGYTPHLQARTAIHPAGEHLPVTRANGITHALSIPQIGRAARRGT